MGFHFKDKNEIKTFILYLLTQIGYPVDSATLNDIVVQDEFVNQFDFMDAFYELCESGAVAREISDGKEVYSISPKGRSAVELLEDSLIGSIKERASRSAMRLLSFKRSGARPFCDITEKDGKFIIHLGITDNGGERMSVSARIDSRRGAELMMRNFSENPEFVYRAVLGVLSGDINYLSEAWLCDIDAAGDKDQS